MPTRALRFITLLYYALHKLLDLYKNIDIAVCSLIRYKNFPEMILQQGLWYSHPIDNRYSNV